MSDEPAQNGAPPDELEGEEPPKPKTAEEAKAARSMDAMQSNKEATTSADVDDAKLANVFPYLELYLNEGHDFVSWWTEKEAR